MRNIALLLFLSISNYAYAQDMTCIYGEIFGASTTGGVHVDMRLHEDTKWGFRIGLARTYSHSRDFFNNAPDLTTGWTLPFALNYLVGKRMHFLEVGVGISFGLFYNCNYGDYGETKNGKFLFLDLGYRFQLEKVFVLRIGVNPGLTLPGHLNADYTYDYVHRASIVYPYFSFGYAF